MSFLDSASSALSSVSSALSGPQSSSPSASDATPLYYKGAAIGHPPPGTGGSYAPNDPGAADTGDNIELIHFGFVHHDYSTNFGHTSSIQDDATDPTLPTNPPTPGSRAVMYRAALERETLLLGAFVASTQTVLAEREQNEGNVGGDANQMVGAAIAEANSLLGGSSSSAAPSGGVKSTDLNDENSKVKAIGGNLNVGAMTYTISHKAGEDLAQQRANFLQVLQKVCHPPEGQNAAGGGLMSTLSQVAGSVPGVGPLFNTISGIATKVFDIYVAVYGQLATHCQLAIEKACHDVTIDAIQNNKAPIFPAWFYQPPDSTSESPLIDTSSGDIGDQVSQLPGKLKDRAEDAAAQTAHKFLDVPTDDYPAAAQLTAAFGTDAPNTSKDQPPKPASKVGDLVAQAFSTALGFDLPGFVKTIAGEIMQTDVELLQEIYTDLLAWDHTKTIPQEEILEAGREALLAKAVDLLTSQLSFLTDLQKSLSGSNLFTPPTGKAVTSDEVMNKGADIAKQELASKLAPGMDPILKFAMGDLATKLDTIRSTAQAQKALTMEVYLGRLPYLEALLFRNTFFPMWDLLVNAVFGKAAGPLSSYLNSAGAFYKQGKSDVWQAQDDVSRAQNVANKVGQGLSVGTGGGDPMKAVQDAWNQGGTQKQQDPSAAQMQQDFPIQGRQSSCTGTEIKQGELDGVTMIANPQQYTNYPPTPAGSSSSNSTSSSSASSSSSSSAAGF
ncbi:MAG TPA: hypothetical protein VKB88_44640 [Bryobacteraceae bacterium]|nr:hypothetical protein [Bryobacteraceae bacterium]